MRDFLIFASIWTALVYLVTQYHEIQEARLELDRKELLFRMDEARWNKAVAYDRLDEYRAMYFEHNLTKNNVLSKP